MSTNDQVEQSTGVVKTTLWSKITSMGPSVVFVLSVLGAGDIVNSSVAASRYGYTLLWTIVLGGIFRFAVINAYAKYHMCNPNGDTLLDGFARLGAWIRYFIITIMLTDLIIWSAGNAAGTATGLYLMFPQIPYAVWGVGAVFVGFLLVMRGGYNWIEKVFKITMVLLAAIFVVLVFVVGPDWGAVAKYSFVPSIPDGNGFFGGLMVVITMLGSTSGSASNLYYGNLLNKKGWTTKAHRKQQIFDLATAMIAYAAMVMCVYIVAAVVLPGKHVAVKNLNDLSYNVGAVLGTLGPFFFNFALFGALFSHLNGTIMGLSMSSSETVQRFMKRPKEEDPAKTIFYKVCVFSGFGAGILAVIFNLNFVPLKMLGMAMQIPIMLILNIGLIIMTNTKKWIGAENVNKWYENLVLGAAVCVSMYLCYQFAISTLPTLWK